MGKNMFSISKKPVEKPITDLYKPVEVGTHVDLSIGNKKKESLASKTHNFYAEAKLAGDNNVCYVSPEKHTFVEPRFGLPNILGRDSAYKAALKDVCDIMELLKDYGYDMNVLGAHINPEKIDASIEVLTRECSPCFKGWILEMMD